MALFVCAALKLTLFLGREECEKYHIKPELSFSLVMVVIYFMFVGARQGFPVTNVSFTPSDDSVKKNRELLMFRKQVQVIYLPLQFFGMEEIACICNREE